jgi:hypothetical protein
VPLSHGAFAKIPHFAASRVMIVLPSGRENEAGLTV